MITPSLHLHDESRVIAALVKLGWMEFPFETKSRTVGELLGCRDDGDSAIWKDLRERNRIELKNRFDGTDRPSGYGERDFWRSPGSWLDPLDPW